MKNTGKKIFAILITAVMLMTVITMTVPVSAENEGTGTYISALSGLALTKEDEKGTWSMENIDFQKNVDMLSERGYTALWFDFNQEAYNNYVTGGQMLIDYFFAPLAIGYQTTTDRKDAITGIVVYVGDNPEATLESNGITYNLMGGWEFEDEVVAVDGLDLNRFTKGEYLYLYYTKDAKAGAPIMALKGSNSNTETGYECVLTTKGNTADLNTESDMAKDCAAYLHIQRDASAAGSVFGEGNTMLIIIVAAVVVIGAGLAVFFIKKKKA